MLKYELKKNLFKAIQQNNASITSDNYPGWKLFSNT